MRKLFCLFALVAMALVSCEDLKSDDKGKKPDVPPTIEFQITSGTSMSIGAEGGELVIRYAITNPDESLSVTAATDVDWISESDALDAPENEIHFVVAANDVEESRSATIVVTYDREYEVVVNQEALYIPPVSDPEFTITSENPVLAVADGGFYYFEYELTNPVEGVNVEAKCDAEWITELVVDTDIIYFTVSANRTTDARTATIEATYGDIKRELVVNQSNDPDLLPYLSGIYFGSDYGATENDYNYSLAIATHPYVFDIVTGESIILEGNKYLFIDLYSNVAAENYNISFTVPAGEYTLDVEDSAVAGTIGARYTSLYDATGEGVETFFVSGKVVVTDSCITAQLVGEDGLEYTFFSEQVFVDNSKQFNSSGFLGDFSTLEGDLNIPFANPSLYAECYDDYYVIGKNLWVVSLDDYGDAWHNLVLEILAPMGEDPIGVFEVGTDLNNERMLLPGFVDSYGVTTWSWYYLRDLSLEVLGKAPIIGGKLTITDNGDGTHTATVDLVDSLGNNITGECTAYYEYGATRSNAEKRFVLPSRK